MEDQPLTIRNSQTRLDNAKMNNNENSNNNNTNKSLDNINSIIIEGTKTNKNNVTNPLLNDISPSTLEALKTLSTISSYSGVETITDCDKLRASLEQIRAKKNMKLFNKLDKIRQDFSGLNFKLAQMEESILDLKEGTSNFVKSLPPDREH